MVANANRAESPEVGREYLRVSKDSSGRMKSTTDQHSDHERDADVHGWILAEPYTEAGAVSASKHGGKVRKGFGSLISDLEHDRFGASILLLWEPSRGSRRTGEWATLLDLLEDRSVKVWVSSHNRLYDPANYRDRRSLLEDAIDAESETGKMSVRILRGHASSAKDGKPAGTVPFGYTRTYHPKTKRFVSQDREPNEAPLVEELFDRLYKGHSFRSIARDFAARQIRSRDKLRYVRDAAGQVITDDQGEPLTVVVPGVPFSAETLRTMALNPAYAGMRVHRGQTFEGQWEPLVDPATWNAVQDRLKTPESVKGRPGGARHLLSMTARCDVCGGALSATQAYKTPQLRCRDKGCTRIDESRLDAYATKVIFEYLNRPDVRRALLAAQATSPEIDSAKATLATVKREHAELIDLGKAGKLSPAAVAGMEPALLARKAEAEQRVKELSTPNALAVLLDAGELTDWPEDMPLSARREVCRMLLTPDMIGELRVTRAPNPHCEVSERVILKDERE